MNELCYEFFNGNGSPDTIVLLKDLRDKVKVYRLTENPPEHPYQGLDIIVVNSEAVKDFYDALRVGINDKGNIDFCVYGKLYKLGNNKFWSRLPEQKRIL